MKRFKPYDDVASQLCQEMEGYCELGMKKESLKLARKLLKSPTLSEGDFCRCVTTVGMMADGLKSWRGVIERGFKTVKRRRSWEVSSALLGYYASVKDWDAAIKAMPRRHLAPDDLMFAMWASLETRNLSLAARLYRRCGRLLRSLTRMDPSFKETSFELGALLDAMGGYQAFVGRWDEAEEYWKLASLLPEAMASSAWDGLVQLYALRSDLCARGACRHADDPKFALGGTELCLPGNDKAIKEDMKRKFMSYRKNLARVLPESERWRYGV